MMNAQSDLFEQLPGRESSGRPLDSSVEIFGEPIALPCGFMDRANNRCKCLGSLPLMVDGVQLVSRGRPLLHCDPACYHGHDVGRQPTAATVKSARADGAM